MTEATDPDVNAVACPRCDSPNTVQIAARGLQYQCRDCNTEFDPDAGPKPIDLDAGLWRG